VRKKRREEGSRKEKGCKGRESEGRGKRKHTYIKEGNHNEIIVST
jgi:hypothetical protein